MRQLFNKINTINQSNESFIISVLTGSCFGEKVLVSRGEIVWDSVETGFVGKHLQEILKAVREDHKDGLMVIGDQEIFVERIEQEAQLVVCGAGHVSIPIIEFASRAGFDVTVIEDRPEFAKKAATTGAKCVYCESFESGLDKVEGSENTFFVIVTRGHYYDEICLERIIKKKHAYIGMLGSRKRAAAVRELILKQCGDPRALDKMHTPIGLHIGAETPAEIAISVIAEMIQVKREAAKKKTLGYTEAFINAVLSETNSDFDHKVLATTVKKKGSTPRNPGTKMIVLGEWKFEGTVGGGPAEAFMLQRAFQMLQEKDKNTYLYHVDMTGQEISKDKEITEGGAISVLLEYL